MGEIFNSLVNSMSWLVNFFYNLTASIGIPNYGVAIIIFTLILKLVLHPLSRKQAISVKRMQDIAPKIKEIEKKYKDKDPQLYQQKVMELYKDYNVNPMAGCLPVLIQMPVLIALYRAIIGFKPTNIEHYNFIWIKDLGVPDPYYVMPVLAVLSTYLLSKITTPSSGGEGMQKTMMYIMPLFIGYISIKFPAGLVLYWIFFNIAGAFEQYYVNNKLIPAIVDVPQSKEVKKSENHRKVR